ncbi:hypothetical protein C2U72_26815, partial [Prosthecomicrobium hirschii]
MPGPHGPVDPSTAMSGGNFPAPAGPALTAAAATSGNAAAMAAAAAGGVLIGADILARHGGHAAPAPAHDAPADAPGDQEGQPGDAGAD